MIRPARQPATTPKPSRLTSSTAPSASVSVEKLSTTSSVTTASTAPTASISTPSASSTVSTLWVTLNRRSNGVMTVGPVTTTSDPNSTARRQSQPSTRRASSVPPTAVTSAPTVISRRITRA